MSKTKVFVCKKCKRADCLVDILKRSDANVTLVGCQKICAGPVDCPVAWNGLAG
jgi:hypothetical protein